VPHAVLGRELLARGCRYPAVPTYDGATVGGTVATNAAGATAFKYGTTRCWVRALSVVLADGGVLDLERGEVMASPSGHFEIVDAAGRARRIEIPRHRMPPLSKLAAGYFAAPGMDLIDLFVGAEGTLGVVTSVELDVLARPPAWFVGLTLLADEAAALALAGELRHAGAETRRSGDRRGIDVAAIEYLDARSLALVREDRADARLGLALPSGDAALLVQVDLDPAISADTAAAEIADADAATRDTPLTRLCRLLARHGGLATTIPALPGDLARRDALFALRESVPEAVNRRIAAAQRTIDPAVSKSGGDPVVSFERLPELLAESRRILADLELEHAIWGHLSDGNLHPNVLPGRRADVARAEAAQLAIGQAAIDLGGSPLSEHGVGRNRVKQELLRRLYGDAGIAGMRAVKRALDPRGLLAPGVIFAP
jgi:D-lactate dehydrogenase (cytochrome)